MGFDVLQYFSNRLDFWEYSRHLLGYSWNGPKRTLSRSLPSMSSLLRCHGKIYIDTHTHTHTHPRKTAKEQNLMVSSESTQWRADIQKSLLILGLFVWEDFPKSRRLAWGFVDELRWVPEREQFERYSGRNYLNLGERTYNSKVTVRDSYS